MRMKAGIKLLTAMAIMFIASSAMAQTDCGNEPLADSSLYKKNLGMFSQYYQQKQYEEAYPYWEYIFNNAPCESKRITWNGAYIGKRYLLHLKKTDKEAFDARKDGLIDTILMTYDARIKHWGDKWNVLAKKAADMYKLKPDQREQAMELFQQCLDSLGNNLDDKTAQYHMQSAIKEHKRDKYTLDSLFQLYFKLQEVATFNIEKGGREKNDWIDTDTTITLMMRPYFTCEKIEEFFKPQTDAKADDVELLKKVTKLLDIAGCNNTDYALEMAIKSYELEPSGESAVSIARSYLGKKENTKAVSWYLKGVDGLTDTKEQEKVYTSLFNLAYSEGNVSEGKKYANKALELNPNNGAAHLIIAWSYAKSASACTADLIDGKSVYWAAVDRAVKAKTVDPSVEADANTLINTYTPYFVTQTDAFFKNFPVAEGGSYTVPCLGVSTIVRFKKEQ